MKKKMTPAHIAAIRVAQERHREKVEAAADLLADALQIPEPEDPEDLPWVHGGRLKVQYSSGLVCIPLEYVDRIVAALQAKR